MINRFRKKCFGVGVFALLGVAAGGLFPFVSHGGETSILISDFEQRTASLGSNGLPKGWSIKVWQGKPDVKLVDMQGEKVLRMRSEKAAVSVYRNLKLDLKNFPVLRWRWKVTKLPDKADARLNNRDDQAAGVYVIFPRFPSIINSQFIGYIWETSAPEGTILRSRKNSKVHYIVVQSGEGKLDEWIVEERNVLDDYRKVFGHEPPIVGGISLMIDSDDTRSEAESYFARIEFNNSITAGIPPIRNKMVQFLNPRVTVPKDE